MGDLLTTCFAVVLFRVAYLISVKGNFNLIYSIDQVDFSKQDSQWRQRKLNRIAFKYIFVGLALLTLLIR